MSRRVYIAAPFGEKARAAELASILHADGHIVVSRWHASKATVDPTALGQRRLIAEAQHEAITGADSMIVLTDRGNPRGTLWEAGVGYEQGVSQMWVGEEGPVFDALANRRIRSGLSIHEIADHFAQLAGRTPARLRRGQ